MTKQYDNRTYITKVKQLFMTFTSHGQNMAKKFLAKCSDQQKKE